MKNESDVREWFNFAKMDLDTARHVFETMRPIPLEIVCYHCQQAAEKYLKGILLSFGREVIKTHDLVFLSDELSSYSEVPENIAKILSVLTTYGVKTRYPKELCVSEANVKSAIDGAEVVKQWAQSFK